MPVTGTDRPLRTRWWAVGALTLSILVIGLDTYVLATALPTLSAKLDASTSQLQWITAAYTLAWSGLLLPAGKLGDRIGRRAVLVAGLAVFGAASVVAGLADDADQLIATRAFMGAGAAMIMTLALALIPVLFPDEEERKRAVTVTTVGTMLGMPLGPLLGGWILAHFAWGWVFLINVPVVVLSLAGVLLWVPESRDPSAPSLDWPGALAAVAGVTGLAYGIIQQPVHGWGDPTVRAGLAGGTLFLALFLLRQRTAATPLVDLRLFRNRGFTWGTIAFAMISFAMMGALFVLTVYLQIVQGNDAEGTGLRLLPMIGAMLAAAALGEQLAARLGQKAVILTGMLVSACGLGVLANAGSGYGIVALGLAVFGAGLGFSIPLSVDVVLGALPVDQAGTGNGMSRTLQNIAVSFSTAIIGSVLNSGYRDRLASALGGLPETARRSANASVAGAHGVAAHLPTGASGRLTTAADRAYAHGMSTALEVGTTVLAVTFALTLAFLPSHAHTTPPTPQRQPNQNQRLNATSPNPNARPRRNPNQISDSTPRGRGGRSAPHRGSGGRPPGNTTKEWRERSHRLRPHHSQLRSGRYWD
ncbi:MFS transporter [Actinomadura opuntiae]|uniref:MFS transporter n=1 Tax=Actinomadura sp. OS1-43 TaxID=604315 RepID=UPI00255AB7FD|nr:MFS transporter [Actinomadura sp. OS1-43]MDL4817414.1 MFS transporter [Actinomadura sp. OS1-43]